MPAVPPPVDATMGPEQEWLSELAAEFEDEKKAG